MMPGADHAAVTAASCSDHERTLPVSVTLVVLSGVMLNLAATIVFVALLMVAFAYVWRRGALEWK